MDKIVFTIMWRKKDTNSGLLEIGFGPIDLKSDGAGFKKKQKKTWPHSKQQCHCDGSLQHNYVQAEILRGTPPRKKYSSRSGKKIQFWPLDLQSEHKAREMGKTRIFKKIKLYVAQPKSTDIYIKTNKSSSTCKMLIRLCK